MGTDVGVSILEQGGAVDVVHADDHDLPVLPPPVGPLSEFSLAVLADPRRTPSVEPVLALEVEDPLGDLDFQRALYCVNEVRYRDHAGVDPDAEWHPNVTDWWYLLARRFEDALLAEVPLDPTELWIGAGAAGDAIVATIDEADGPSLSEHVARSSSIDRMREFSIHRSAYQLKEADPHTFALPRLAGPAKAAFVEIQMDEYGEGRPGRAHADLFAKSMRALGLDDRYGHYVDRLPASTLATVNLITHLAFHRRLLPALLGHLALFEMTSVGPMGRYAAALRQLGMGDDACEFYDVHVEADEHHGPLARHGLVDAYVADHPTAAPLAVWGAQITMAVEARFARHLIESWDADRSSLLD